MRVVPSLFIFIICVFLSSGQIPDPFPKGCKAQIDVVFVIDGSDSISERDFETLRTSISRIVDGFHIGSGETRMGIIVYSKGIALSVPLSYDPVYLKNQASIMPHPREGTNTHIGIEEMIEMFKKDKRDGVPMAGVVVTDGISKEKDKTLLQSKIARDLGINMFSVGVGRYTEEEELRGIASNPNQAIKVESFDELLKILSKLVQLVCPNKCMMPGVLAYPNDVSKNCRLYWKCEGEESKLTCCPRGYSFSAPAQSCIPDPKCVEPCGDEGPVVSSIHWTVLPHTTRLNSFFLNHTRLRKSISSLVDDLNIGEGNGRMGMLVYSSSIATMVEPSTDKDYLKGHAMSLPHPREGTNTALGIKTMAEIFGVARRPDVPQIGVVITDGESISPAETARQARIAKDLGITMYAVGVGISNFTSSSDLYAIASSNANILSVDSFGSLSNKLQEVVQLVCPITTSTTSTTPMPTTTPTPTTTPEGATPPLPPTVAPGIGPCDNCKMVNGIGFNPHPDDCDKFVQCYFGTKEQLRVAYRQCPFGQYWDQNVLTCRPSEYVECEKEKCRNLRIKSYAYSNTDNCRVHWACNLGKATATCCAEGSRYVPYRGCVEDPKCKDVCPPTFHQEGPCDTRMIFNKPNKFEQYVTGFGWVEMPCAPGTQFDPNTCQCSLHDSFLPGKQCKAELFIPFSSDTNDYSGNNIYVENQNVSVLGNGLGYFNGESRLIINRFSNIDFYTDLVIKMRFLEDTQATGLRAMFSNGDCCDNPASMMMISSKANLHFMAKTEVKKNNTAIDKITTFHLPVMYGNWNEAYYMHNTMSLEGKVNGIGLEKMAYGPIKRSQAALHIGYGRGFQNFKGYMDYVAVFLCRPKYL